MKLRDWKLSPANHQTWDKPRTAKHFLNFVLVQLSFFSYWVSLSLKGLDEVKYVSAFATSLMIHKKTHWGKQKDPTVCAQKSLIQSIKIIITHRTTLHCQHAQCLCFPIFNCSCQYRDKKGFKIDKTPISLEKHYNSIITQLCGWLAADVIWKLGTEMQNPLRT